MVAIFSSKFLDIHWIHVLTVLLLSSILYQILEWKFDWIIEDITNE